METQDVYSIFIKWYAMPKDLREPKSMEDFCKMYGITKAHLTGFTDKDNYYEDLVKEAKNWGKSKLPEMLHILYTDFKENKKPITAQTFKQLLELDKEQKVSNINVFNLSDDQYRQIVTREAKLLETSGEESTTKLLSDDKS